MTAFRERKQRKQEELVGNHILAATEDKAGLVSELVTSRLGAFLSSKKENNEESNEAC